ncbi:MAG: hypothetical protein FIB08_11605 [Candidatus Methanoperedens sp.]|nr:hypothetical protein [Candidatus Methanoperedens sp.]
MKQKKNGIFLIAVLAIIIIASAVLLSLGQKPLFPEKLGDMELKLHREGEVAVREIQNSHSAKDNVSPDQAHVAQYRNSAGNRATVSITAADTEKKATEKVDNMTRGMGVGGMFSIPEVLKIDGLKIYYTEGGGGYHYYYSKNNLVIWIAISNQDRIYRSELIDEAVKSIGG